MDENYLFDYQPSLMDNRGELSPQEQSLLKYHQYNMMNHPLQNADNSTTTVFMTGLKGPDDREYIVPGYIGGRILGPDEAARFADLVGWGRFPSYKSVDEANSAAKRLHQLIERPSR